MKHHQAKEAAKGTRLASAFGRLYEAYGSYMMSEAQARSRVLEGTLGRLISVLPKSPQAFPPREPVGRAQSADSEQQIQIRLKTTLRRLLTAIPRSSAQWQEEPRILNLVQTYKQALSQLGVGRMQQLAELATRLSSARRALRADVSAPEYFNLFEVLRIKRREYVHSNVLAWLLDPLGNHGLGTSFLNCLLGLANLPPCADEAAALCSVSREVRGDTSIVDIRVDTPDAVLIIENKVDAREGEEQTKREWGDFFAGSQGRPFGAIFLTVDGESPESPRFLPLGYRTIWQLLCDVKPPPEVEPFLLHYRTTIERVLLGGQALTKFKGFRPETNFVLEHHQDIQVLTEAIDAAETDLGQLLTVSPLKMSFRIESGGRKSRGRWIPRKVASICER